jgi:hypothetical protein
MTSVVIKKVNVLIHSCCQSSRATSPVIHSWATFALAMLVKQVHLYYTEDLEAQWISPPPITLELL